MRRIVALTVYVLVLIMASVAGVVLRTLLLVVAAAAAAKHLVEEAKLGIGEGEEGEKSYQEPHLEQLDWRFDLQSGQRKVKQS